jgi:hypothetical protein
LRTTKSAIVQSDGDRSKQWVSRDNLIAFNDGKNGLMDTWCQKVQNCDLSDPKTVCPSEDNCSVASYPTFEDYKERDCSKK